ncbi:hypothetical protein GCK72_008573 [Caenorhabditis remanei]|uniref:Sdz-33 F-box domain-containing protein n=1 Tax=Caenorhabditis remanei TaxID=31234 RepID=A0A6A5H0D6_CAERE|nr:hypothetical protein GCK72_008573 [Caenorhabditis remanei]KAF1760325.1 hypothetical protein GCK72_008573 [Caenorhabditis remanei]
MLLVNSEEVNFYRPTNQNQFNRFVKHWIHGSNPRLQRMSLSIDFTNSVSRDVLLKGIRCMDTSEEIKRDISQRHWLSNCDMVQIRRKDGTPAVIATKDGHRSLNIHLIVMH